MSAAKKARVEEEPSEIMGYIHNVSPIKLSRNNKYFNAVFQDHEKYSDLVCFVPEYNQILTEMQKAKSPVCLAKVDKSISTRKPGLYDLKVTSATRISVASHQLDFRYEQPEDKVLTITEVKALQAFQKVSVKAKIMSQNDPTLQTIKSGEVIQKQYLTIADATNSIQLCAWDKHIEQIQLAKCYTFCNVSLRNFDNVKSLTTCPDTRIDLVDDIGPVKNVEVESVSLIETITVDSVSCVSMTLCGVCNKDVGTYNSNVPTLKCKFCNMRQNTSKLQSSLKAQINCKLSDEPTLHKLSISNAVLKKFTDTNKMQSPDDIEDYLLSKKLKVEMTPSKSQILRIIQAV
ncbi:uncharacterized protein LOC128185817 [Crassostrea angulata]|uniref:uncharacterized protein LOC128185817 n=1 Tax=Magallana angulata TaxID=2784310 RepID=UPI0022B16492|nr:uncharacterized protein LOC128185817 [Crassostrea angulata]